MLARPGRQSGAVASPAVSAVVAVAVGLVLAGCGSGGGTAAGSASSKATASPREASVSASASALPSFPPVADGASLKLTTNQGDITIAMDPKAPVTDASMAYLAGKGFFNGTNCHRLTTQGIFVLQCGDPKGNGTGGPGYEIPDENLPANGANNYPAGTVAMANSGPDTNGSQFFITVGATTWLNFKHTIFGEVADQESRDVVDAIATTKVGAQDRPVDAVVINSVTIERS